MTTTISTKDTAKMLREALRNAFPGVKFSVRMSRGTGSAWLGVFWTDGPTETTVRGLTCRYQGRQFDGMTDGYNELGSTLIVLTPGDMPEEVHFAVDGINGHRNYSPAAWLRAQELVRSSSHPEIEICTPEGAPIQVGAMPEWIVVDEKVYSYNYSPAGFGNQLLHATDLTPVTKGA